MAGLSPHGDTEVGLLPSTDREAFEDGTDFWQGGTGQVEVRAVGRGNWESEPVKDRS